MVDFAAIRAPADWRDRTTRRRRVIITAVYRRFVVSVDSRRSDAKSHPGLASVTISCNDTNTKNAINEISYASSVPLCSLSNAMSY